MVCFVGITGVLVALVAVLLAIFLLKQKKKMSFFDRYNIPGPKPSLFLGHVLHLQFKRKLFIETEKEWIDKYGKVVGFPDPTILIADLELLKQLLIKEFSNFSNRPDLKLEGRPALSEQLTNVRDQKWKFLRTLINPTFSARKMKMMTSLMNGCTKLFLQLLEEKVEKNLEFDIYSMYQGLTLDVIAQCALALQIDCQKDPQNFILRTVKRMFAPSKKSMIFFFLLSSLPFSKYFLTLLYNTSEIMEMETGIVENLREVIQQRRQNPKQAEIVDALQLMINATDREAKEDVDDESDDDLTSSKDSTETKVRKLTDMQIIANAYLFLLAGFETTSTALAFVTYLLTKHQDIQQRLYDEIITNLGLEEEPNYDNIQKVPYVEQVLNESIRLYPPIPTIVSRDCKKEITVNGVTIPAGCTIQAAIWTIHHDPEIWEDPEEFNPDRFSPENKSKHHPLQFLSFGAGPRNCIGARFAKLEAKLLLVQLIRKYKLLPSSKFQDPLKLQQSHATLNPADGVWIRLEERNTN